MKKFIQFSLFVIFLSLQYGCSVAPYSGDTSETNYTQEDSKVEVEAYLIDAKLKQKGKPTSVRLFFYQTDSVIAIGGKGYLGKGALKGWVNDDSILVVFPTMDEFLYESIDDLFASFNCTGEIPKFNFMALFKSLPDETDQLAFADITTLDADSDRPRFRIKFPNCKWKINITYDKQDAGYRIRNFNFNDGEGNSLNGKRREYKSNSEVSHNQFEVEVGAFMNRIIP